MGEISKCRLMPFAAGQLELDLLTTCDLKATPAFTKSHAVISNAGAYFGFILGDKISLYTRKRKGHAEQNPFLHAEILGLPLPKTVTTELL